MDVGSRQQPCPQGAPRSGSKADIKEMHNKQVIAKRAKQWIHEKTDIGLIWGKEGGLGECSLKN